MEFWSLEVLAYVYNLHMSEKVSNGVLYRVRVQIRDGLTGVVIELHVNLPRNPSLTFYFNFQFYTY